MRCFMAGARGNGSGVASAGILGAGLAALTNGFPIVSCPPVCQEARPLTDLGHVGSVVFGILLALVAIWSLWPGLARVGSCGPLRQPWWSGLSCRWRTPRSHRRAHSGMVGGSAPSGMVGRSAPTAGWAVNAHAREGVPHRITSPVRWVAIRGDACRAAAHRPLSVAMAEYATVTTRELGRDGSRLSPARRASTHGCTTPGGGHRSGSGVSGAAPCGAPGARRLANPPGFLCRRTQPVHTTCARGRCRCEPSGRSSCPGQRPNPRPRR